MFSFVFCINPHLRSASRDGKITVYFCTAAFAALVNVDALDSNYFSMCNGEASISVIWIIVDHSPILSVFCTVASFDMEKYMAPLKVRMLTFLNLYARECLSSLR